MSQRRLKVSRQIKDGNVTIYFKDLQNVTLGSISYHIIPRHGYSCACLKITSI